MTSDKMIYEGVKKAILEWIEMARADVDSDYEEGWEADDIYDEAEEDFELLKTEIGKLDYFVFKEGDLEDLGYFADQAFENVKRYIYER